METEEKKHRIGLLIRNKIKEKGYKRSQFAGLLGRSTQWLKDIETGKNSPRYEDGMKIEELLEIKIWSK